MSCPDCFTGHVHEGTPRGIVMKVQGLDTYVTNPTDGRPVKAIIVIIPDAYGWEFVNNRLLADHYAEKGDYRVYLPEFMNGSAAPPWMLDAFRVFMGPGQWLKKLYYFPFALASFLPFYLSNGDSKARPRITSWFKAFRDAEAADLPVGAAGFCWGGKYVVVLAADTERAPSTGKPLIDAGFTAHPSRLDVPAEIEAIKLPVSFAIGDKDMAVPLEQAEEIKKIVEAKPEGQTGEVKIYENAGHGFGVRADIHFMDVKMQAAKAEHQCIDWFNKHFGI